VLLLSALVALYVAPPTWIVFVLIRSFRLPFATHLLQVGVFIAGWILSVPLFALLERQHLPDWFLD
jgi:hypothetical protein